MKVRLQQCAVMSVLLAIAAATRAQGRVWRVAPTGGDYTEIRDAVVAARSGDVISVTTAPGPYAAFSVSGKSLTIMSADSGKPLVLGMTDIANLPPGGIFRVVNLRFRGRDFSATPTGNSYTLILEQYPPNPPTIPPVTFVLSGCEVETGRGYWSGNRPGVPRSALVLMGEEQVQGRDTLFILDHVRAVGYDEGYGMLASNSTLFANECTFHGGGGMIAQGFTTYTSPSGVGAWMARGRFYLTECEMRGGTVPPQVYGQLQNGGEGMRVEENATVHVFARRATCVGGDSGDRAVGARGGYGLWLLFTSSQVYVDGQPFVGGMTRAGTIGQVPAVFGTPPPLPRNLGALSFDRALADLGSQTTLSLTARPREPHLVFANAGARLLMAPGILEPLPILGIPGWFPLALLFTDATGAATMPLGVPADPLLSAQALFVQGIGFDAGSQLIVDTTCSVTLR